MRILFTTEGTYPTVVGGVSTWCDQLLRGLSEQEFEVMEITGPLPVKPSYDLPSNVVNMSSIHLWRPRKGVARTKRMRLTQAFQAGVEELLRFAHEDQQSFAAGLRRLSRLGSFYDLWPLFENRVVWQHTAAAIEHLLGETPRVAEVAWAVNWLRATLVPLLFIPPQADQAHSTSNGLSAIPAWLAAKEHGVPLMLTEHGLYLRERYLGLSSEVNPPGLKLLRARFYRQLARLIYQDATLIVSVSEFNRAWQIELGAQVERTRVVYNGVAPEAFPKANGKAQSEPTVSWVGRIDPIKDLETLISSFEHVKSSSPDAKLRLFGPVPEGNEGYYQRLAGLVSRLKLTSSVSFEGKISPVHRAYHAADVVALSSISEGFPYVAIEAMMCGRPVVATSVGGVGEAIGSFGRMVEPRDPQGFGAALTELLLDAPLRQELGDGARHRALSQFTLDHMYRGYRTLYSELSTSSMEPA